MNADESVNTINKYIPDLNIRLGGIHGRFEQVVVGKATSGFEILTKLKRWLELGLVSKNFQKFHQKQKWSFHLE